MTTTAVAKKKIGRRTKLSPEVHEAIILSLVFGSSDFAAAMAAGIAERSFYEWMSRGQEAADAEEEGLPIQTDELPFLHFSQDVRRARGHAIGSAESRLFIEDPGAWLTRGPQARTRADRDGWSQQVAVVAPDAGPDRIDTGLSLGEDIIEEVIVAIAAEVKDGAFQAVSVRRKRAKSS